MAGIYIQKAARRKLKRCRTALVTALLSLACACAAATTPPNPGAPNPNAPPYPVLLTDEQGDRRGAALGAWARLMHANAIEGAPEPELHPVTATIARLPQLPAPLYLPKVGEGVPMTEEETREALRRFINDNRELLGIDPPQLSLVQRTDAADGTKRALYQQRAFRYNFRNGFGAVEITFTPDRRILNITSTAIPDIERLRVAGAGIAPRAELQSAEQVVKSLAGRTISYTDAAGRSLSYTITPENRITPRQFVIYPVLREDAPPALEFHLAWEIMIEGAPLRTIYLDAITNEILSATTAETPAY
ncbi:MAG: hypothetical protein ICV60_01890 [Pyrinomonadaceae bacterium]|nr:hypothetical protein [Pyrinomonadaceae bacterium]